MGAASNTWHDMALYLIARYAGATVAQELARSFALQWDQHGLAPYIVFEGRTDHGDSGIDGAQHGLARHFSLANPVEEMIRRSRLAERTFKRRFTQATGLAPIAYVQRLRVEDAKPAGAHWRAGRRGQLARRLRGRGVLPAPVQAHHRHDAGRVPQALSHSRLRAAVSVNRGAEL